MSMRSGLLKGIGAAAIGLPLLLFGFDASAQAQAKVSACKGLEAAACKAKTTECTWVVPKAGKQKPYCRSKPAKKKKK
jgi:hypothetical protein